MESKNELSCFLEDKLALLKSYDALTEKMLESFRKGELDGFMIPLSRREELIKKIEKLDSSLRELMSSGEDEKPEMGDKTKGMPASYYSKTKRVLEQIALKENDLIPKMRGESEELKREIMRMRETRHAVVRYHNPNPFSPRFLDARK
jgi:hypothetical protein